MEFKNVVNEKGKSVKETPTKKSIKGKKILVNDVVFIYDEEDTEENYDSIVTLDDVLALDKKKPNVLLGIQPSLYSAFRSVVTKNIEPYVSKGDEVVYRNVAFSPDKENPVLTVDKVIVKSLGNMSVIIAEFTNGDFALTNLLKKV